LKHKFRWATIYHILYTGIWKRLTIVHIFHLIKVGPFIMKKRAPKIWGTLLGFGVLSVIGCLLLLWFVFFGPFSFLQNKMSLEHLREIGYIPQEAHDIYISDAHGGFHGDGDTFLVFSCPRECLISLKDRIERGYSFQIARGFTSGWSGYSDANISEINRTIELITSQNQKSAKHKPDIRSPDVIFLCGDKNPRDGYCGSLFAIDFSSQRFWYLNITT